MASPTSDTSSRTHMTDTSSSSGDCSIGSPHRRTRTVSPHHNRSLSFQEHEETHSSANPV
ncbi:hypothetical protein CEXT_88601, partial [Caerostris extrusa]